jgi:hypothetical protein
VRIRGVLLRTLEEQRAGGDPEPVDPNLLRFDPETEYPLLANFDPKRVVGTVKVERGRDGTIYAIGEIKDLRPLVAQLSIGFNRLEDGGLEMWTASLGGRNVDTGLPDAELYW